MAGLFGAGSSYDPVYDLINAASSGGKSISGSQLSPSISGSSINNIASLPNLSNVPPTTTTQEGSRRESTSGTQRTTSTTNRQRTGIQQTDTQNITDQALAVLNAIVQGRDTDPLVEAKDEAALGNIQQLQELMQLLNPAEAEERASGRVADLSRQLREQVLPQIFGEAEFGGTGLNALSRLMAQDAAIRTGEAQSRAVEEALNTIIGQRLQGSTALGQLTGGTSAQSQRLMEAIGLSRGAVQRGTTRTAEQERGTTRGTTTTTGSTTGTTTGQQATTDPLAWANLLSQLSMSRAQQDPQGEILSAFLAAGGDPARLQYTPRDFGAGAYNQDLLRSIEDLYARG